MLTVFGEGCCAERAVGRYKAKKGEGGWNPAQGGVRAQRKEEGPEEDPRARDQTEIASFSDSVGADAFAYREEKQDS